MREKAEGAPSTPEPETESEDADWLDHPMRVAELLLERYPYARDGSEDRLETEAARVIYNLCKRLRTPTEPPADRDAVAEIVRRLRRHSKGERWGVTTAPLLDDAADEIERLRAMLDGQDHERYMALIERVRQEPTGIDENSFREGYEWGFGDGFNRCERDPDKAHDAIVQTYAMGLKPEYRAINRMDYRRPLASPPASEARPEGERIVRSGVEIPDGVFFVSADRFDHIAREILDSPDALAEGTAVISRLLHPDTEDERDRVRRRASS